MTRRRGVLLLAAAVAALSIVALTRGAGRTPRSQVRPAEGVRVPRHEATPRAGQPLGEPLRNVFRYSEDPRPGEAQSRRAYREAPAPVPSQGPPLVRVVGLVTQGESPRLVLSVDGESVVLSRGESGLGYTFLGLEGEGGARVRTPDGSETILAGPE